MQILAKHSHFYLERVSLLRISSNVVLHVAFHILAIIRSWEQVQEGAGGAVHRSVLLLMYFEYFAGLFLALLFSNIYS